MSFFNEDDSSISQYVCQQLSDYDSFNNHSFQSETQFLKDKLIETHEKLMRQLNKSKELEEKVYKLEKKAQTLSKQNVQTQTKYNSLHKKNQYDRVEGEKNRILQMKIEELEKKNQLLKGDLESMRTKMLEQIRQKNTLEDELNLKEDLIEKLNEKTMNFSNQTREKNKEIKYLESQIDQYKKKIESIHQSTEIMQSQVHELKRENKNYYQTAIEAQTQLKSEKDKNMKLTHEIKNLHSENKFNLTKIKEFENTCQELREELYWVQNKEKVQSQNAHDELERLTHEVNTMNQLYKQKQKELQRAKKKPIENLQRKKKNLQHTKEFVHRLESEQHNKRGFKRSNEKEYQNSFSPKNKKYKHEKDTYISMISEVGDMETILTNCNIEKKKILAEIDKIQETRVKTKDMISRRRRLQDDLAYQEQKIKKVKEELRKMKVM